MRDVALELWGTGDTLADRLRAVARGTVVVDVVRGLLDEARQALREAADAESARTGTAFTARLDGVSAVVTDPQPKPRVTDEQAFAGWAWQHHRDLLDIREVEKLTVLDETAAWQALIDLGNDVSEGGPRAALEDGIDRLLEALDPGYEFILPADPWTPLVNAGRIKVNEYGVVDIGTGEYVPGTAVSVAKPTLQVKLKPEARAQATREVRAVLGLPDELGGAA